MGKKKNYSIRMRVITAFLVFTIAQSAIFLFMIFFSGIVQSIYDQSYGSFNFQVLSRSRSLNETFNSARSGFIPVVNQIELDMNRWMNGQSIDSLDNQDAVNEILKIGMNHLVAYLDNEREVSGVFLFLENDTEEKDCIYIRDNSYGGNVRGSESKIYVRGPSSLAKSYNYQLYYLWQPRQSFAKFSENALFALSAMPLVAANASDVSKSDMFYWSKPYQLAENEPYCLSLTIPIVDDMGKMIAVCGFEMSADILKKLLPYSELSSAPSMYILSAGSLRESEGDRISSSPYVDQLFVNSNLKETALESDYEIYRVSNPQTQLPDFLCIGEELKIYNKTSVFEDEHLYLYGLTEEATALNYPRDMVDSIVVVQIVIFLLSVVYIILITFRITRPIKQLSAQVAKIDPEEIISLPRTKISEIDELGDAVELLSNAVAASASRLNTIIEIVGLSMGGFEERQAENKVFLTDSMSRLLGLPAETRTLDYCTWSALLEGLNFSTDENMCVLKDEETGLLRWLRIKKTTDGLNTSGVIMDISEEVKELRRLEYERNYDNMTKILNRRGFVEALEQKISESRFVSGALIMLDLDNLKYINDSFGHDVGDAYLVQMANALKEFEKSEGIISRMAGDEFVIFIPCNLDYVTFKNYIMILLDSCKKQGIILPNGEVQRLRFSAGIAWYPKDSDEIETLIKYADFAMYETKHNIKGTVAEFDLNVYNRKSYLINKLEMLELLIEREEIRYMLQPIVDALTGEVFAYEMLMRSEIEGLRSPHEILNLAKTQSKLYYIELIGFHKMFGLLTRYKENLKDKLIFYNMVPTILLKEDDWSEIMGRYGHLLHKVVAEIAESDEISDALFLEKSKRMRPFGSKLAIDDWGLSFNCETALNKMKPEFVKIDMSLVRDIDSDEEKQSLVRNLISYCTARGIKTIAEGIETYEEMSMVRSMGADYYQGYYLARPSYDIFDIAEHIKQQVKSISYRNLLK